MRLDYYWVLVLFRKKMILFGKDPFWTPIGLGKRLPFEFHRELLSMCKISKVPIGPPFLVHIHAEKDCQQEN